MPIVDPNTKEPLSDGPDQPDELRGGKLMEETVNNDSEFSLKTPHERDYHSAVLPGEKKAIGD